jgi:hypothetical protein
MGNLCAAVELLLARMDSNPEEFTQGGRWDKLIAKWKPVLPMPDRVALENKLNTLWLEVFHKDVMNELLVEPSEEAVVDPGFYQGTRPGSSLASLGVGNALTNQAAINLSQNSIKDIAAAMSQYAANTWRP